jgi:myosin heavy subunit
MFEAILSGREGFEMGKSRVYFKAGVLEKLEQMRLEAMGKYATSIGATVRMFLARVEYEVRIGGAPSEENMTRQG